MKKKLLVVAIISSSALLSACSTTTIKQSASNAWQKTKGFAVDNTGLLIGCTSGIALGYLAKGEKGALIGGLAGCGIGLYFDEQKKKMKALAQEQNMDVLIDEVEVTILDTDNTTQSKTKLLSSSFVHKNPMFNTGSANLSPEAKGLVEKLAANYKASGTSIMVVGHSDASGSSEGNKRLSEKRAQAVANLLASKGMPKNKIYFQGAGESQPIASNNTEEGKSLNRRVEFVELGASAALSASNAKETESAPKSLPKEVTDRSFTTYAEKQKSKLSNIENREVNKKATRSKAIIDFGGKEVISNSGASPLYAYLGEPEKVTFSFNLIPKAQADSELQKENTCLDSEPMVVGEVKSLSGNVEKFKPSDYAPGMNGTVWYSNIKGHLITLNNVRVTKNDFRPVGQTEGRVYKDFKAGDSPFFQSKTTAEVYEGKSNFLYRVYFDVDSNPMECMDVVMPKYSTGNRQALAGLFYYQDESSFKSVDFAPSQRIVK